MLIFLAIIQIIAMIFMAVIQGICQPIPSERNIYSHGDTKARSGKYPISNQEYPTFKVKKPQP